MNEYYLKLKKKYNHIVYVNELNNYGNLIIIVKNFDLKYLKSNYLTFVEYIYISCLEALKISKKINKKTFNVHIYLEGANIKHFSIKLSRMINKKLSENLIDVLNKCYIYGFGPFLTTIYNIIKCQLDPVTKKKIIIIKRSNIFSPLK